MMNDRYVEELGRVLKNTYSIQDYEPMMIGKLVLNLVKYFNAEEERDLREKANQAQYGDPKDWAWGDEASERRIDIIGANSNEGLHYDN